MMCFREKIAYLLLPSAVRQTRAPKFFIWHDSVLQIEYWLDPD
jgi:hypothetical protein